MTYIYVASPFTHPDSKVRDERYHEVMKYTHYLTATGYIAFSPILHCKDMADKHGLPHDFDYWETYNFAMMLPAKELHVLAIEGWIGSKGVSAEIRMARMMQKPTKFARWNVSLEKWLVSP